MEFGHIDHPVVLHPVVHHEPLLTNSTFPHHNLIAASDFHGSGGTHHGIDFGGCVGNDW